jgi:BirA family transcriptional regulator, biotin operon repressor / biotin---[acetyl-CoA-carboxylase] ligase
VVHYWNEVDSTNAALLRLIPEGAVEGTVVLADRQTAGRGRIGKPWFSPPGLNLHLSVLLKPPIPLHEARLFTLIGSLAVADVIETYGVNAQVKWPNDVLVNDRKVAGVLTDVRLHDGRVEYLILGIGVNLNIDRPAMDRLYREAAPGATSLCEVLCEPVDRTMFAARVLEALETRHFEFLAHGKDALLAAWRSRSFLGRRVTVREEDLHVEGVAMDLDEHGCLVVHLDDGSIVRVREGEVSPLA